MLTRTLKTAALAAAIVVATAGASMAATWAYVDQDSKVRANHYTYSPVVNYVDEGQKVRVIAQWNNWYKLKIPDTDGWVKGSVLDFDYYDDDYPTYPVKPGYGFGSQFCVEGKKTQFCLGTNY